MRRGLYRKIAQIRLSPFLQAVPFSQHGLEHKSNDLKYSSAFMQRPKTGVLSQSLVDKLGTLLDES
jgi:hypothetical protein